MGLTEEQVDSIIEEHTNVTDALKEKANRYEADAEKLKDVQAELNKLKDGKEDWEEKYNSEHKAFEDYKKDIESKEKTQQIKSAYKALLQAQNVDERRIDKILKLTDFSTAKLGKDGKFENEKELADNIKSEWGEFIVKSSEKGTKVDTPPGGTGKSYKSKAEIYAIKDDAERRAAIAENHDLFGI